MPLTMELLVEFIHTGGIGRCTSLLPHKHVPKGRRRHTCRQTVKLPNYPLIIDCDLRLNELFKK
jgi:hypothetical protein